MGFIIYPPVGEGGNGGGTGDAPVKSVNGKTGHVFLTYKDLNAVQNLQGSVGGIGVGTMNELPLTPENGTLYITTDRVPNSLYLYNRNKWEKLSGGQDEVDETKAIAVTFNNKNVNTKAKNVQTALEDAFYQITVNKNDCNTQIDEIRDLLAVEDKDTGKIKLTEHDTLGYLSNKLDDITLAVEENVLTVKGIQGLRTTMKELNSLIGIKDNVQTQIDKLSNVGGLATTVPTYKELEALDDVIVNDVVIVLDDETHEGETSIYMLNRDRQWEYIGTFHIELKQRDFIKDPINLQAEVTGILPEDKIDNKLIRRDEFEKHKIHSTDDVPEGFNNLYYKDSRVDTRIDQNKQIKGLLADQHTHFNKEVIDELGETEDGLLTYRGQIITGGNGEGGEHEGEVTTDGRVKISADDVLGYLGTKLDNDTMGVSNNKIYPKSLKDMIATVNEINQLQNIRGNIQQQLDNAQGQVKIDRLDNAGYLGTKIDRDTIVIKDNKLLAKRLDGQIVSITEINFSKGLRGNIQDQLDELSKVGSFIAVVDKHTDLNTIKNPIQGDLVLVSFDETHDDTTTFYMYDKGKWTFVGSFHIDIRNFETDPLNLNREVTGVLDDVHIDPNIVRKYQLDKMIPQSTDDVSEGRYNKYFTESRVTNIDTIKENTKNRHNHNNKNTIDELSESQDGKLLFKNKEITVTGEIVWDDF